MLRNMHGNLTTLVVTSKLCVSASLASLHFNRMTVFSKTIEQHLFQLVGVAPGLVRHRLAASSPAFLTLRFLAHCVSEARLFFGSEMTVP